MTKMLATPQREYCQGLTLPHGNRAHFFLSQLQNTVSCSLTRVSSVSLNSVSGRDMRLTHWDQLNMHLNTMHLHKFEVASRSVRSDSALFQLCTDTGCLSRCGFVLYMKPGASDASVSRHTPSQQLSIFSLLLSLVYTWLTVCNADVLMTRQWWLVVCGELSSKPA